MTDRVEIEAVVADCERYWRVAGLSRSTASDMRQELERHLTEAAAAGRSPGHVIGGDLGGFAREWAEEQRPGSALPAWDEVVGRGSRLPRALDVAILLCAVAIVVVAFLTRGKGDDAGMDNEIWRWIWLGLAVLFGVGEIFTAGFFMLPFSVGAVVAFVLSWFDVPAPVDLAVFLTVSVLALLVIQRLVRRADQRQVAVGANRFVGRTVVVLERVDRVLGTGRVRMDTETWRATTDGEPIEAGAEARVVEVRGTRLVLEHRE